MHLDSLVTHAAHIKVMGRQFYGLPTKRVVPHWEVWKRLKRFPFARWGEVTCASVSFFDPPVEFHQLAYFKRFDGGGFPANKVNRGSGHFRDWMLRWTYQPARTVTFYARGDVGLLRDLLSVYAFIGNDNRVGWGEVLKMRVEPMATDQSIVVNNVAQRPIPVRFLEACSAQVMVAWKPPYWSAKNVEACAPPGATVKLRDA